MILKKFSKKKFSLKEKSLMFPEVLLTMKKYIIHCTLKEKDGKKELRKKQPIRKKLYQHFTKNSFFTKKKNTAKPSTLHKMGILDFNVKFAFFSVTFNNYPRASEISLM